MNAGLGLSPHLIKYTQESPEVTVTYTLRSDRLITNIFQTIGSNQEGNKLTKNGKKQKFLQRT